MQVDELIRKLEKYGETYNGYKHNIVMRMHGDFDVLDDLLINHDGDEYCCDLIGESEWGEEE